ncbi:MAG: hypothetical protein Q9180_009403, partial [Flavoplaca navasiana]
MIGSHSSSTIRSQPFSLIPTEGFHSKTFREQHQQVRNRLLSWVCKSLAYLLPVAILLYPPLWDLKAFQGTKYKFHVSPDLRFPSHTLRGTEHRSRSLADDHSSHTNQAICSMRIQQLVNHLMNNIGTNNLSHDDLARSILGWITTNVYKSFEASVESSVRCWYNVKSCVKARSSGHVEKKRLCERFRQLTLIKQHQMEKAK